VSIFKGPIYVVSMGKVVKVQYIGIFLQ